MGLAPTLPEVGAVLVPRKADRADRVLRRVLLLQPPLDLLPLKVVRLDLALPRALPVD